MLIVDEFLSFPYGAGIVFQAPPPPPPPFSTVKRSAPKLAVFLRRRVAKCVT